MRNLSTVRDARADNALRERDRFDPHGGDDHDFQCSLSDKMISTIGAYNGGSIGILLGDLNKTGALDWQSVPLQVRLLEPVGGGMTS